MSVRTRGLILAIVLATPGCLDEPKDLSPFFPVSGRVNYQGAPVRKGVIHLMPIDPKGTTASGEITEGMIKNVTSHTQGDGAKPGKYRVSISIIDAADQDEKSKGDSADPAAASYVELMSRRNKTIALRYSDIRRSGLTAEITAGVNDLRYDLKDE
jgi:hypothetical protein